MATPKTTAAALGVAAVIVASLAAYMVYNYLNTKEQEAAQQKMGVQQIAVAATEIPFGAKIQAAQVKMADWPKTSLPEGFSTDPKALEGRTALSAIPSGSPILESSLASSSAQAGVLSYIIPDGHRAMTVGVNEVVGVAGFVLPGSVVDVVATVNSPFLTGVDARISKIILQNIKVLAVGQILEQKEGKPAMVPTVTLDVLPDQAEKLALASENKVQLILKHLGDEAETKTKGATIASLLSGYQATVAVPANASAGKRRAAKKAAVVKETPRETAKEPQKEPALYIDVIRGDKKTMENVNK